MRKLDESLESLAARLGKTKEAATPGAGALGGLGFGMLAFFHATLRPGVEIVIEATNLRQRLQNADLCITGEGRLDAQSLSGKTPIGIARLCKELGVPCVALVGTSGEGSEAALAEGLQSIHAIRQTGVSEPESMRNAANLLAARAGIVATGHL